MALGIYISVPFCRSKCSYCNFASGVFSSAQMGRYVGRLCADIVSCRDASRQLGAIVPEDADAVYLGGGTPSLLPAEELKKLFAVLRQEFRLAADAEITVECAPGTIADAMLESLVACGVNRVSLGVQSFVNQEAASVARLHNHEKVVDDIERLRRAGIGNINVDLIAGLPHQTPESWSYSLQNTIGCVVPHLSVYMLEVDEDSRLGRELMAGGSRYHAHFVPDDDATASFYESACEFFAARGVDQYEISNFARPGFESRHNLKYWTRSPYAGFGVDAHSMLPSQPELQVQQVESIRFATTDSYDEYLLAPQWKAMPVGIKEALEESFFLALRLNRGVNLGDLQVQFGERLQRCRPIIDELISEGLLQQSEQKAGFVRLTPRGRLLSNDVFARFIDGPENAGSENAGPESARIPA
ncbi:MAG TPA: radical SAM family heme chaperone HemW [Candidatus Angelobacter sp.]|nr:radical SAM family heme chaperone HemW [Candidatus Angelobacter sp.]